MTTLEFPSASYIRTLSASERIIKRLERDIYDLTPGNILTYCVDELSVDDVNNITLFLKEHGYHTNVKIRKYINTNICTHLGCAVYHIPNYEPSLGLSVALNECDLPPDIPPMENYPVVPNDEDYGFGILADRVFKKKYRYLE